MISFGTDKYILWVCDKYSAFYTFVVITILKPTPPSVLFSVNYIINSKYSFIKIPQNKNIFLCSSILIHFAHSSSFHKLKSDN